jgi:hypothetical protein
MFEELTTWTRALGTAGGNLLRSFARRHHRDDGISTAEAVILTALFAGLAIAVAGIIIAKVTERANSISL